MEIEKGFYKLAWGVSGIFFLVISISVIFSCIKFYLNLDVNFPYILTNLLPHPLDFMIFEFLAGVAILILLYECFVAIYLLCKGTNNKFLKLVKIIAVFMILYCSFNSHIFWSERSSGTQERYNKIQLVLIENEKIRAQRIEYIKRVLAIVSLDAFLIAIYAERRKPHDKN